MKMTQFANFANNATKQILGTSGLIRENLQSMFSYPNAINVLDPITVSGNTIFITDGAPLNAKHATVYIEPLQTGSGDPSPENVRPISGWAGVNVIRTGANMFGGLDFANILHDASHVSTIDTNNKTVTFDRYKSSAITIYTCRYRQMTAIITYSNSGYNNCLQWTYSDGTYGDIRLNNTNGEKTTSVFTSNPSKNVIALRIGYRSESLTTIYYDETGLFRDVVTVADFVPYIGIATPITFPNEVGTVYGGILDVTDGVLTVTHGNIASYNGESLPGKWISSMDVYSAGGTPTMGAQVVYKLATPLTYQLTPTNISILNGINTLYADCGSMELEYYRSEGGGNPYD